MRCSAAAAAAVVASANAAVGPESSSSSSSFSEDRSPLGDYSVPLTAANNGPWTRGRGRNPQQQRNQYYHRYSTTDPTSVLLTNRIEETRREDPCSARHRAGDDADCDDADLGILSTSSSATSSSSSKRFLSPSEERTDTELFDSFNAMDPERTNFYPMCDPSDENNPYECTLCGTFGKGTAGAFRCRHDNCYEIDSRCPNNRLRVCRNDTLKREFTIAATQNEVGGYHTERCRNIETRLTKNDGREMLPGEEDTWEFSYCTCHDIFASRRPTNRTFPPSTCEMEVDGIVCSSCELETIADYANATTNANGKTIYANKSANATTESASASFNATNGHFCARFDCGNTVLGYSGRFCNAANLAEHAIDYFVYRSLPCDDGCNLCGPSTASTEGAKTMMMMQFRESVLSVARDDEDDGPVSSSSSSSPTTTTTTSGKCFEEQWKALIGPTEDSHCNALRPVAEKSCGCTPMGRLPESDRTSSAGNVPLLATTVRAAPWIGSGVLSALLLPLFVAG